MDIQIMTSEEYGLYARERGAYFTSENYESDYFQRFLRMHEDIHTRLLTLFEACSIDKNSVEIRQNADNLRELLLVVCRTTKQNIVDVL